jgi:hypothetical protein
MGMWDEKEKGCFNDETASPNTLIYTHIVELFW